MTNFENQENPYRPPDPYGMPAGAPGAPPGAYPSKPKWLGLAVVGSMCLGALGVLAGLWAPVNYVLADSMQDMFKLTSAGAPGMEEFQKEVMAASMPGVMAAIGVFNLGSGGWVLWTGFKLYKREPGSRAPFRNAVLAMLIYSVVAMVISAAVQVRVWSAMNRLTERIAPHGRGMPPEMERTMQAVMGTAMVAGLVFALLWAAAKIGFLVWARGFVNRPEVVSHVDG